MEKNNNKNISYLCFKLADELCSACGKGLQDIGNDYDHRGAKIARLYERGDQLAR